MVPESREAIPLVGDDGLDVTQAPNGNLIDCRYTKNLLYVHQPDEPHATAIAIKSVFPHRGGKAGGSTLKIYGTNLSNATVSVGAKPCPVIFNSDTKLACTLPGGTGTVDIVVVGSAGASLFARGYRFVPGI